MVGRFGFIKGSVGRERLGLVEARQSWTEANVRGCGTLDFPGH